MVAIVLRQQGILPQAYYWTISDHSIPHVFWEHGILMTLAFVGACLPLLIGAAMAFRDKGGVWAGKGAERTALLGLLGASGIGAAAGARFYPHYYIQLIPPLTLLAAPYYARSWSGRVRPISWLLRPAVTYAWLALTVIAFSVAHWHGLASQREPSEAGRYLLEHSNPEDRIFSWGQEPKVYLDARRRPASRYVTTFPLTGYVFGEPLPGVDTHDRILPGAWNNLERDFRKHPPIFIVDEQADPGAQYPIRDFPMLAKLLAAKYREVARTDAGVIYRIR